MLSYLVIRRIVQTKSRVISNNIVDYKKYSPIFGGKLLVLNPNIS
jgi:hypothetical protein